MGPLFLLYRRSRSTLFFGGDKFIMQLNIPILHFDPKNGLFVAYRETFIPNTKVLFLSLFHTTTLLYYSYYSRVMNIAHYKIVVLGEGSNMLI